MIRFLKYITNSVPSSEDPVV